MLSSLNYNQIYSHIYSRLRLLLFKLDHYKNVLIMRRRRRVATRTLNIFWWKPKHNSRPADRIGPRWWTMVLPHSSTLASKPSWHFFFNHLTSPTILLLLLLQYFASQMIDIGGWEGINGRLQPLNPGRSSIFPGWQGIMSKT